MNWKDTLHYGAAACFVVVGIVGALAPVIPGVHIDPTVCFSTAAGMLGSGFLKGGLVAK